VQDLSGKLSGAQRISLIVTGVNSAKMRAGADIKALTGNFSWNELTTWHTFIRRMPGKFFIVGAGGRTGVLIYISVCT
jgi:hypothetical protein